MNYEDKLYQSDAVAFGNFEANLRFLDGSQILKNSDSLLEIGSGKGIMLDALHKRGFNVRGVEIHPFLVSEARRLYPGIQIDEMSGDKLEFPDNSFDIVLSFDVFEHIPDSNRHLEEVSRVLKPGGYYLLQTPNLLTNFPWELYISRSFEFLKVHCSLHTYWSLRRRFKRHEFEVQFVDIPVTNEFTLTKVRTRGGTLLYYLYRMLNPDRLPLPLRTNFYVIARSLK